MPPKKDAADGGTTKQLVGFEDKETKLLAAAFVSCIGPDKVSTSSACMSWMNTSIANFECMLLTASQYDYDLMAKLTGNTSGSLKKMWPPIKRKATDAHASFATFLGANGTNVVATPAVAKPVPVPKATGGRKRKAAVDAYVEAEPETKELDPMSARAKSNESDSGNKSDGKVETKNKVPTTKTKARSTKKVKKEVAESEDSTHGGDGLGEYARKQKVVD
jgi:hypothetical protein